MEEYLSRLRWPTTNSNMPYPPSFALVLVCCQLSLTLYDSADTSITPSGDGDGDSTSVVFLSSQIALIGDDVSEQLGSISYDILVYVLNVCIALSLFLHFAM